MPNTIITPQWVMKTGAAILVNNTKFAGNVTRFYADDFKAEGAKVGYTVQVRLPQRYTVGSSAAVVAQAVQDTVVPVTITSQKNIAISFTSASLTMEVSSYRDRYLKPQIVRLANQIDQDGLSTCYLGTFNTVGTPGTSPTANSTYLSANTLLSNSGCPIDGRKVITNPGMMAAIVNANTAIFNPQAVIAAAFRTGQYATDVLGFEEWYQDQNVAMFTVGTYAGTPRVNGAGQAGTSLALKGFTGSSTTLVAGDHFTIANVNAVNPQNYVSTGSLQQFELTAGVSDVAGNLTATITPSIIVNGQYQTVDSFPADSALITMVGTSATANCAQGLAFHPDAFVLAMADLLYPESAVVKERMSDKQTGIAMRFIKGYSADTDIEIARMDVLYGWKVIRPELACIVQGGA